MPAAIDMTGIRYGRLIAIAPAERRARRTFWSFGCDCGQVKDIDAAHVRYGRIRSCGCLLDEVLHSPEHVEHLASVAVSTKTHGLSGSPVHAVWKAMVQRCTNPKAHDYRWYGALGVKVCDRWRSFENFFADMGEPNGLTLDRIDPAGDYEPSNCRWATWETQRTNKRADRHAA